MAHTKRLYYADAYKLQHTAKVTQIADNIVQLDATIFHPQGGGQPSDTGTIAGIKLVKLSEDATGEIYHILETAPHFKEGDPVTLEVDAEPRVLFTRLHSAGHLLAHVAEQEFPELKAVQGHHFPNEARVEFVYETLPDLTSFQEKLIAAMQAAIKLDTDVTSKFDDNLGRSVIFGCYSETPCGGTHVKSVGEIRGISIRSIKNKGGRLRVGYDVI